MAEYDEDDLSDEFQCPKCKGRITRDPTCPTYMSNGTRYRCMPCCGNATEYDCINNDCDWFYIDGIVEGDPGWEKSLANGAPEPIPHEFPLDFKYK